MTIDLPGLTPDQQAHLNEVLKICELLVKAKSVIIDHPQSYLYWVGKLADALNKLKN